VSGFRLFIEFQSSIQLMLPEVRQSLTHAKAKVQARLSRVVQIAPDRSDHSDYSQDINYSAHGIAI
jgi:hypothetical protein